MIENWKPKSIRKAGVRNGYNCKLGPIYDDPQFVKNNSFKHSF